MKCLVTFKSKGFGSRILIDGLYKLKLHASSPNSLYVNSLSIKRTLIKETLRSLVLDKVPES